MAKILFLSYHPAPYHDYVYSEIAHDASLDVSFLHLVDHDERHKEWEYDSVGYSSIVLGDRSSGVIANIRKLYRFIIIAMDGNYDILIAPGTNSYIVLVGIIFFMIKGKSYVYQSDSIKERESSRFIHKIKSKVRGYILSRAAALYVPGAASENYHIGLGVPSEKIFKGAYCTSGKKLINALGMSVRRRLSSRDQLGINRNQMVLLSVGNMQPFRHMKTLVEVCLDIGSKSDICLIVVGDGPDMKYIRNLVRDYPLDKEVIHLVGNVAFDDLPFYYGVADLYIHAGQEPFSTATEIAALAGLPIIASKSVGFIADLSLFGGKPIVIKSGDRDSLRSAILEFSINWKSKKASYGTLNQAAALKRSVQWAASEFSRLIAFVKATNV